MKNIFLKSGNLVLFIGIIILIFYTNYTFGQTELKNWWITNNDVYTTANYANYTYISGKFSYIGPNNAYGSTIDINTKATCGDWPKLSNRVLRVIPDDKVGWYIAGEFATVNNKLSWYAAHLNPDENLTIVSYTC